MSMNATDAAGSDCATSRATVDFPEPEPPAIPTMNGLTGDLSPAGTMDDAGGRGSRATRHLSRLGIDRRARAEPARRNVMRQAPGVNGAAARTPSERPGGLISGIMRGFRAGFLLLVAAACGGTPRTESV